MTEQKYYKIVSEYMYFYNIARMNGFDDMSKIYHGKIFHAYKPSEHTDVILQHNTPLLHFTDNAFDAMLWASKFNSFVAGKGYYFYEIVPLTQIIKQRCNDSTNLYQCGAYKISFRKQLETSKMFDLAISEYEKDPTAKQQTYPDLDLEKIVRDWRYHIYPKLLCTR